MFCFIFIETKTTEQIRNWLLQNFHLRKHFPLIIHKKQLFTGTHRQRIQRESVTELKQNKQEMQKTITDYKTQESVFQVPRQRVWRNRFGTVTQSLSKIISALSVRKIFHYALGNKLVQLIPIPTGHDSWTSASYSKGSVTLSRPGVLLS